MDHQGPVRHMSARSASQMHVWVWFFKNSRCWKLASEVTLTTILSSCSPAGHHVKKNQCKHHVQIKVAWSQKVFHFCSNLKKRKRCQISPEHYLPIKKRCSGIWFGTFFLDLRQTEKSSEIMPPLGFDPTSFNSLCIENCSDQLWEKTVLVIKKIRCWRPRICNF